MQIPLFDHGHDSACGVRIHFIDSVQMFRCVWTRAHRYTDVLRRRKCQIPARISKNPRTNAPRILWCVIVCETIPAKLLRHHCVRGMCIYIPMNRIEKSLAILAHTLLKQTSLLPLLPHYYIENMGMGHGTLYEGDFDVYFLLHS